MSAGDGVVLVVDDSSQDLALVKAAFAEAGCPAKIRTVQTVDGAIDYLSARGAFSDRAENPMPDLVLLDLQMPARDGFDLLGWIRGQRADWHRVPVIMLTTSHDFVEIRKAYDAGANSFLVKPTGFDELVKMVAEISSYWLIRNRAA